MYNHWGVDGFYCERRATIQESFPIRVEAWHNVVFVDCDGFESTASHPSKLPKIMGIVGSVGFHNPYGYLPAELYGLLPFEVCFRDDDCGLD